MSLVRLRAITVWATGTAVAVVLAAVAAPEVIALGAAVRSPRSFTGAPLDQQLATVAAVALACGTAWLWALLTVVVARVGLAPSAAARRPAGVPRVLHRWVLAACGLALAGGLVAPAHASATTDAAGVGGTDRSVAPASLPASLPGSLHGSLHGLPLPERATLLQRAVPASHRGETTSPARSDPRAGGPGDHVVRPGDSLWRIAADRLPADATDARVAAATEALHELNRAEIGADPDLIHPTQRLRLPGA